MATGASRRGILQAGALFGATIAGAAAAAPRDEASLGIEDLARFTPRP
jgi:hypothetical protein